MLGASFLHFAWIFPRRSFSPGDKAASYKALLWLTAIAVSLLAFVPGLVIQTVTVSGNRSITTGGGIYAIALFMVVTSVWAFGRLARQHTLLRDIERAQSRYVLTGSAVTALTGLLCNLLLPLLHNYAWVWLGPTSS
ncbi:MAG: hypothetical protein JOZ57_03365, partial [Abitibacteriaceae bacterium]|nr:hypothetical protein [Abditibacteriaceae bacterium]